MQCDLHVHTRASDGRLSAKEVVALAKEKGLAAIAITDHDTTAGIEEGIEAGDRLGLRVIGGIEISTEWKEEEVHVLGYLLDYRLPWLQERLANRREGRVQRAKKIIRRLAELGIEISWDRVAELAGGAAVGRPHIAMAMIEKGYVSTIDEAFRRFLDRGAPAYVPRSPLLPEQAVDIIRDAGGAPVLAHPGLLRKKELVYELLDLPLAGLEVYYPEHDAATTAWLERLAADRGLLATGGSDFHGYPRENHAPLGACTVTYPTVLALEEAASAIRRASRR